MAQVYQPPKQSRFGQLIDSAVILVLVWAALFAPPGTPDAVVQKMNQAIVQVNALPSMKALVLKLGSELPPSLTPAQTKDYLKAQRELYQVAASRIQPE